ncbi:hypothetical protein K1719_000830 [Acacia pycnantha]|nr:hypothetical protein K1719_000830 [Acacia pycnantha]
MNEPDSSLSSWNNGDTDPCLWSSITATHNTSVTKLDLSSSNIDGPFPASILCNLTNHTTLILYNNSINDALPPEISLCCNLVHVDLAQNLLTGALQPTLSDLPNLWYLDF